MESAAGAVHELLFGLVQDEDHSGADSQPLGDLIEQHLKCVTQIVVGGDRNIDGAQGLQVFEPAVGILIEPGVDDGKCSLVGDTLQQ